MKGREREKLTMKGLTWKYKRKKGRKRKKGMKRRKKEIKRKE